MPPTLSLTYLFKRKFCLKNSAILLQVLLAASLYSQPGSLDSTFSDDGKTTVSIGSQDAIAYSVFVQQDGKILLAGQAKSTNYTDFGLTRLNPDGSLDSLFGNNGLVVTSIGITNDVGYGVVQQDDGKILVVGTTTDGFSNRNFGLVRYKINGATDSTFGVNGRISTAIGLGADEGFSIKIQEPDNKIIVAGRSYNGSNYDFALVRYHPDGALDSLFGSGGKVTTALGLGDDAAYQVALQPDGKIVLSGESVQNSFYDFAVARYLSNGALDPSFGGDGMVTMPAGFKNEHGVTLAIQKNDHKIVVGGYATPDFGNTNFTLARLDMNGLVDSSFGNNGSIQTNLGISCFGQSVAIQDDGEILLAGQMGTGSNADFGLACYHADGTLNTQFGNNGIITTDFNGYHDAGLAMTLQPDGKILLVGESRENLGSWIEFAAARYNPGHTVTTTEPKQQNRIAVYPNPVQDGFTLQFHLEHAQNLSISLFDFFGKNFYSFCNNSSFIAGKNELYLQLPAGCPAGMYLLAVSGKPQQYSKILVLNR